MNEIAQIREDLQMVEEARKGHPGSAERLAARLECIPRILTACNVRMGRPLDRHDLDDLIQDASVVVLSKLDTYEGRASIEGWVYRICTLEILNAVRRKRRRPTTSEDAFERRDSTPDPRSNPMDGRYEQVHEALDSIKGEEADVIRLKHFEGLTFDEIGRLVGCPSSTAKTRYYRGLFSLERMLTSEGDRP